MPYPDEAEGFQVDGPNSYTQFHKRFVSHLHPVLWLNFSLTRIDLGIYSSS